MIASTISILKADKKSKNWSLDKGLVMLYDMYVLSTDGDWVHFGKVTLKNWRWIEETLPWFARRCHVMGW